MNKNLLIFCLLLILFMILKVNSSPNNNFKKICGCVLKTKVHNKSLDKGSKGSSSKTLLDGCNSDCSNQKVDEDEIKESKKSKKKIGRSKSEKDAIESSKIEIENLKNKKEELEKELLNLKSEIIEINENNEKTDLKGKRRVKSFNDFYPIPADRKIR
uniref:Uncharacterized protein n=1 Tax=Meloidogyne enterolobii TaxID=390850 RepID=A0A6V7VE95_MELEN|nr:unnamed protein product [Meloidogyne enterolobii]